MEIILVALERYQECPQWTREAGRFIPHPATWLNQRRFDDEQETEAGADAPAYPPGENVFVPRNLTRAEYETQYGHPVPENMNHLFDA